MTLDLSKIQRKIQLGGLELLIPPLLLPSKVALFRYQTYIISVKKFVNTTIYEKFFLYNKKLIKEVA
jgi:hypothetical protein